MNDNEMWWGAACYTVGCLIVFLIMYPLGPTQSKQAADAIKACEKSLPRDKECELVITARVKEKP